MKPLRYPPANLIRGKLSFYWSSERHSELSPPHDFSDDLISNIISNIIYIPSLGVKVQSDAHYSSKKIISLLSFNYAYLYANKVESKFFGHCSSQ